MVQYAGLRVADIAKSLAVSVMKAVFYKGVEKSLAWPRCAG